MSCVEMENGARKLELEKLEEVEEEDETTLIHVRKSRTESKVTENSTIIIPEMINGELISESEGWQSIQSTATANGAHQEESTLVNDGEMEKPDGVFLEGVEAEKLVFFDKVEGIWKCRICTWTYQNGIVCTDHIQNHIGRFHKPMRDKTLKFKTEGVGHGKMETLPESHKAFEEIESADVDLMNEEETEYEVETVLQNQNTHDLYCPNCSSCITRRVILRKRKHTNIQISYKDYKRNKTENPPVQPSDDQVDPDHPIGAEEDVDRDSGLDLFRCLSCFSFFIPTGNGFKFWKFGDKSRKEKARDEQVPGKPNWFTSMFAPRNQDTVIEQDVPRPSEPLLQTHVEKDDTSENDAKKEQHEVLAGCHLKEPIISNDQSEVVSGHHLEEPIRSKEQLEVFTGYHLKEPVRSKEHVEVIAGNHLKEPVIGNDQSEVVSGHHLKEPIRSKEQLEVFTGYHLKEPVRSKEHVEVIAGYHLKEPIISNGQSEVVSGHHLKEPIRSKEQLEVFTGYHLKEPVRSKEHIKVIAGYHLKEPIRGNEEDEVIAGYHLKEPVINRDKPVTPGSDLLVTTLVDETEIVNEEPAQDAISVSTKGGSNLVIFSNDGSTTIEGSEEGRIVIQTAQNGNAGQVYPTEISQQVTTKTKVKIKTGEPVKDSILSIEDTGKDTVITIDSHPASEIIGGIVIPAETAIPPQTTTRTGIQGQERTGDVIRDSKIEVIKSIVYGGLAESITCLSVVSSAAGGDATTLNILALAMANLIGGFFVICHNLWELRCEQTDEVTDRRDRYRELLGRKQNFKLHAIVCVLSYLVFGLTPILVYGFSFRQSDERELKLLVVGAVSLVCIIGLSIGKAYVCRPPKAYVKTVVNFVLLGFMASGISYAAGVLVKRFLESLGLFQPTSGPDMIFNQVTAADSTWASY